MAAQPLTAVHYSDVHFPFQDARALRVVLQIMDDLKPELVVNHGDLLDCTLISRFEKDPKHRVGLAQEITLAASHLQDVADVTPGAERILIKGNHEDRLRRLLWKMSERGPAHEILNLPQTGAALNWPSLLQLEQSGWEWEESKRILFGKMILKHGSVVRKWSGQSAKAEMERYGKSGMSGHTHRMGAFLHRDWNGQHGWWELGCLCGLDPDYTEDPDWQHGAAVVTWAPNRQMFAVEPIHIHKGKALFRGKIYG